MFLPEQLNLLSWLNRSSDVHGLESILSSSAPWPHLVRKHAWHVPTTNASHYSVMWQRMSCNSQNFVLITIYAKFWRWCDFFSGKHLFMFIYPPGNRQGISRQILLRKMFLKLDLISINCFNVIQYLKLFFSYIYLISFYLFFDNTLIVWSYPEVFGH
jgi:hypothetical protein